VESALAAVWRQVLGLDRIGRDDNFFDLGGDSIRATQLAARARGIFDIELPVRAIFEAPTIGALAHRVNDAQEQRSARPGSPIIRAVSRLHPLPLSSAQRRLWFLDQLEPGSAAYNVPAAMRLRGHLDEDAMSRAIDEIVRRHETLRTTFAVIDGEPAQVIHAPPRSPTLRVVEALHGSEEERDRAAREAAAEEARRPFDLTRGPLTRVTLLRFSPNDHVLLIAFHHIVADGWSTDIFLNELAVLYGAHREHRGSPLAELPIQYADYAVWQRERLDRDGFEGQIAYWREELAGAATLDLPTDRPRHGAPSFRGVREPVALDAGLASALRELGRRSGATLFMTLLAAFQALLHRYSGQDDICVGAPIAGRQWLDTEPLLGFFVNTLVLRGDLSGDLTFLDLLAQSRRKALDAFRNQDIPFERVVEELRPDRDLERHPLFQVMLALQNMPSSASDLPGLRAESLDVGADAAKFDLALSVGECEEGIAGMLEYSADLFDAPTIRRFLRHFENLLRGITADPTRRISQLPLLEPGERELLVEVWSGAEAARAACAGRPRGRLIHELIHAQALECPEAPAVAFGEEMMTYRALDARSERLASRLRSVGVGADRPVGLCIERSSEMIVGILGILKSGGAYVPIEPAWPADRIAYVLGDTGAEVVVTRRDDLHRLAGCRARTILIEEDPIGERDAATGHASAESGDASAHPCPENLAYILYTSGSTGSPKGVSVTQENLLHSTLARGEWYRERVRSFVIVPSIAFDSAVAGIFWTLCDGGLLVLPEPDWIEEPASLAPLLARHQVTHWLSIPAIYDTLLSTSRPEDLESLRTVIVAGESCPPGLVARHHDRMPRARLFNEYGPTEATVWCTAFEVSDAGPTPRVPIGRPIPGSRVYVLDRRLEPVPPGVAGELFVAGPGVSRGYLGRPDLTAERFLRDPFTEDPTSRLYRTGDLARWLPGGVLEFLGRRDEQVKIRGVRVEAGEIEAVLSRHPDVAEAAVVAEKDGVSGPRLWAFVVPRDETEPKGADLRRYLAERLPPAMIPARIALVGRIPRTVTEKLDRRALLAMRDQAPRLRGDRDGTRDDTERRLEAVWREVLGLDAVGITDGFFELGGHSLLALTLIARVEKEFGLRLPVASVFREGTVEMMAARLRQMPRRSRMAPLDPESAGPPFFLVHPVGGTVFCYRDLAQRLGSDHSVHAIESPGLDGEHGWNPSIEDLAAQYATSIQEVQREGPYRLGGWSFGGLVALEVARVLMMLGHRIALLALIDTHAPPEVPPAAEPDESEIAAWIAAECAEAGGGSPQGAALRGIANAARGHLGALRRYQPQAYPGSAHLILAAEADPNGLGSMDRWRALVEGEIEVCVLPTDHYAIVREPDVRLTADRIRSWLEKANVAEPRTAGAVENGVLEQA